MSRDDIRKTVLGILGQIAPEADLERLRPEVSFRNQLDIDSVDFLNFLVALDKQLHVQIPEADYAKFTTLNGCVGYLATVLHPSDLCATEKKG